MAERVITHEISRSPEIDFEIGQEIKNSTVAIIACHDTYALGATGVCIGDGKIITVDHCFERSAHPSRVFVDDLHGIRFVGKSIKNPPGIDLAVIQVNDLRFIEGVELDSIQSQKDGDPVIISTYQEYPRINPFKGTYCDNDISIDKDLFPDVYQSMHNLNFKAVYVKGGATLTHGGSGSGVFNLEGKLLGIVFGAITFENTQDTTTQTVCFLPSDTILHLINE